jgi:signal peptidase I
MACETYPVSKKDISKNYTYVDGNTIPVNPTEDDLMNKTIVPEQSIRHIAKYEEPYCKSFIATWGESIIVEPGDYIVHEMDVKGEYVGYYRIKESEFDRTYDFIKSDEAVEPERKSLFKRAVSSFRKSIGFIMS